MEYTGGIPQKNEGEQVILKMKNHPTMVGMWNGEEGAFVIANVQASIKDGNPWDHYYESDWIDENDIEGWWSMPS